MDLYDSVDSECDTETKRFKCAYIGCKAKFSKNRKLINHIRRHKGERPFVCDEPGCLKSYTNSSHLLRHKKSSHGSKITKTYQCGYESCKRILSSKWNLKKHILAQHCTIKLTCKECSLVFRKKKRLQEHMFTHIQIPTFKCKICGRMFSKCKDLSRHEYNHTVHTVRICTCGEQFLLWSLFRKHKNICGKELTCEICSEQFSTKSNLKQHQMIHRGKTAEFKCEYENCNRSYFYKKNLTQHVKLFHNKEDKTEKIPCPVDGCKKHFKRLLYLRRHLQMMHEQKEEKPVKKRSPRFDKGKPVKSMASIISGVKLSVDENKAIIRGETIPLQILLDRENAESSSSDENEKLPSSEDDNREKLTAERLGQNRGDSTTSSAAEDENGASENLEKSDQSTIENQKEKESDIMDSGIPVSDNVLLSYCDSTLEIMTKLIQDPANSDEQALSSSKIFLL